MDSRLSPVLLVLALACSLAGVSGGGGGGGGGGHMKCWQGCAKKAGVKKEDFKCDEGAEIDPKLVGVAECWLKEKGLEKDGNVDTVKYGEMCDKIEQSERCSKDEKATEMCAKFAQRCRDTCKQCEGKSVRDCAKVVLQRMCKMMGKDRGGRGKKGNAE